MAEERPLSHQPQKVFHPSLSVSPIPLDLGPGLSASPEVCSAHRFVVLTVKALLCRLWLEDVVLAVEHGAAHTITKGWPKRQKRWEKQLHRSSHFQSVSIASLGPWGNGTEQGVLEMHHVSRSFRERLTCYLVMLLSREESCWRVSAVAFLVKFLQCLETEEMVDTILQLMSSHLQCDCKEIRRLVLRGLLVLCKSPWKASLKTLLQATEFLKKRKFKRLLKREQPWRCSECLLAKDRNTTDKYWHQSLAYLQSSQESMREVAIEFIGLIGQHMRGRWQEEFQIICDAQSPDLHSSTTMNEELAAAILTACGIYYAGYYLTNLACHLRRVFRCADPESPEPAADSPLAPSAPAEESKEEQNDHKPPTGVTAQAEYSEPGQW
ncbi:uncharacterized protein M8220_015225 [Acridotheres tristis]